MEQDISHVSFCAQTKFLGKKFGLFWGFLYVFLTFSKIDLHG